MFRTDTPFIIRSLRTTVYGAVCTYHAEILKWLLLKYCHMLVLKRIVCRVSVKVCDITYY